MQDGSNMIIKDVKWGYDIGKIPGDPDDGYLNVEAAFESQKGKMCYVWINRSMEFELVLVSERPMFERGMNLMHYDTDYDKEYASLCGMALEHFEQETGEGVKTLIRGSGYKNEILFAFTALNLMEQEQGPFLDKVRGKDCDTFFEK